MRYLRRPYVIQDAAQYLKCTKSSSPFLRLVGDHTHLSLVSIPSSASIGERPPKTPDVTRRLNVSWLALDRRLGLFLCFRVFYPAFEETQTPNLHQLMHAATTDRDDQDDQDDIERRGPRARCGRKIWSCSAPLGILNLRQEHGCSFELTIICFIMLTIFLLLTGPLFRPAFASPQTNEALQWCGDARYYPTRVLLMILP